MFVIVIGVISGHTVRSMQYNARIFSFHNYLWRLSTCIHFSLIGCELALYQKPVPISKEYLGCECFRIVCLLFAPFHSKDLSRTWTSRGCYRNSAASLWRSLRYKESAHKRGHYCFLLSQTFVLDFQEEGPSQALLIVLKDPMYKYGKVAQTY